MLMISSIECGRGCDGILEISRPPLVLLECRSLGEESSSSSSSSSSSDSDSAAATKRKALFDFAPPATFAGDLGADARGWAAGSGSMVASCLFLSLPLPVFGFLATGVLLAGAVVALAFLLWELVVSRFSVALRFLPASAEVDSCQGVISHKQRINIQADSVVCEDSFCAGSARAG